MRRNAADDFQRPAFARIVCICVQKTNCYGLHVGGDKFMNQLPETILVQRGQYMAVIQRAFTDFAAHIAGNQRFAFSSMQVIQFAAALTPDFNHVTKSFCRD